MKLMRSQSNSNKAYPELSHSQVVINDEKTSQTDILSPIN